MTRTRGAEPGPRAASIKGREPLPGVNVLPSNVLLETLVMAVAQMRECQRRLTPGAPAALRAAASRWEQEVDELVALHLLPPVPDLPAPEVVQ